MNTNEQMRDAIGKILWCCQWMYDHTSDESVKSHLVEPIQLAKAALAAPPRNCDVGTAEEQGERCMAQFDQWRRKGDGKKLITAIMAWTQMPYEAEEGGAE